MRSVVTGGAGFIGSNLVRGLLGDGHEVVVVDNLATGRVRNLREVEDEVEFVRGDVCDLGLLERAFGGAEVVFHQAALPSVARSVEDPVECNANNVDGTLNVLWASKRVGVRRVVYAGSSSAYGNAATSPKVETMMPAPLSPYAVAKLTGEHYAKVFHEVYGLETVVLRYFNVFGPRQDPASAYAAVVPAFVGALLAGSRPVIHGDGEQTRDFTYVDNAVQANLRAASAPATAVSGEVFNVGCGHEVSVNHLLDLVQDCLGVRVEPLRYPPRPGDVRHSLASIDKARKAFGYEPIVDLREGIARTVAWYRDQGP